MWLPAVLADAEYSTVLMRVEIVLTFRCVAHLYLLILDLRTKVSDEKTAAS